MSHEDDAPTGAFEIGRLHGRVSALESRADKQEGMLEKIDSKLDTVIVGLASVSGGNDKAKAVVKFVMAVSATAASVAGAAWAIIHGVPHNG